MAPDGNLYLSSDSPAFARRNGIHQFKKKKKEKKLSDHQPWSQTTNYNFSANIINGSQMIRSRPRVGMRRRGAPAQQTERTWLLVPAASQQQRKPACTSSCCYSLLHRWFMFNCSTAGIGWTKQRSTCRLHAGLSWEMTPQHQFQNERRDREVSEAGNGGRFTQLFHAASAAEQQLTTARWLRIVPSPMFLLWWAIPTAPHIKAQHSKLTRHRL